VATLMEDLITVLNQEADMYTELLELAKKKTPIIVKGEVEELQSITDEEQEALAKVEALDKQRTGVMKDIANVTNRDVNNLKLKDLIQLMDKRPEEHDALASVRDRLNTAVSNLKLVNEQNGVLIRQSLDMINFNLALERSMRTGPETGNYTRYAANAGDILGGAQGGFDAKQ